MPNEKGKETKRSRYFLVFVYPPGKSILLDDIFTFVTQLRKIRSSKDETAIDVILNSVGGDIYTSYKMGHILRSKCSKLEILVPLYAKSAATLLALSGDYIYMGDTSELGPLDLPIEHPTEEGISISALDGVRPVEYFAEVSNRISAALAKEIRGEFGLGRKDSLRLALSFTSSYITPITAKLDPSLVNKSYRELTIAAEYGLEFLRNYMFKSDSKGEEKAFKAIWKLVYGYPSHGFAICRNNARTLGLKIKDDSEYDRWTEIWDYFVGLKDSRDKVILLCEEKDLFKGKEKKEKVQPPLKAVEGSAKTGEKEKVAEGDKNPKSKKER